MRYFLTNHSLLLNFKYKTTKLTIFRNYYWLIINFTDQKCNKRNFSIFFNIFVCYLFENQNFPLALLFHASLMHLILPRSILARGCKFSNSRDSGFDFALLVRISRFEKFKSSHVHKTRSSNAHKNWHFLIT